MLDHVNLHWVADLSRLANVLSRLAGSFDNSWGKSYVNFSDDNDLVPLHLRRSEIVLKCKKLYNYFIQECEYKYP